MQCSLLAPRVRQWIENGHEARVLNLFADVCNLIDAKGEVISLVVPSVGIGPFSLVAEQSFTTAINLGSPVIVDPRSQTVTIGQVRIETSGATLWNPRPSWHALRSKAYLIGDEATMPPGPELELPLRQLLAGIGDGRPDDIGGGAFRLAGLGRGLTPSGDDILMGVLYGLWVWKPELEWIRLIVDTAVPRTTSLSAAFLRAAGDGEATIQWHDLVRGRNDAVKRILAIGESSGRDAWNGFVRLGQQLSKTGQ